MLIPKPKATAPIDSPALSCRYRLVKSRINSADKSGSNSTTKGKYMMICPLLIYSFIEVRSVTSLVWRLR